MLQQNDLDTNFELLYRFKNWVERLAQKPHSAFALFLAGVVEASLLPIPIDMLFLPLSLARPKRALFNAFICVTGSTIGAVAGYYIGYGFFESVGSPVVNYFGWREFFDTVLLNYKEHASAALMLAGFTPIPFEIFTYAAGFRHTVEFSTFLLAVFAGRSIRFLPVGIMLYFFGADVKEFVVKYVGRIALAVPVLILIWYVATTYLF